MSKNKVLPGNISEIRPFLGNSGPMLKNQENQVEWEPYKSSLTGPPLCQFLALMAP